MPPGAEAKLGGWGSALDSLCRGLKDLHFGPPTAFVYNPLEYARAPHERYLERYASAPKQIVLLGMNPGPWGMVQTGIPFGEIAHVRDWLGIDGAVTQPPRTHPKRPVEGFGCRRSEVSGRRLWGWARERFKTPKRFFARFFVANYCPLAFMEASGKNRTPNALPKGEQRPLLELCDAALAETVRRLDPEYVIGVGQFAAGRAREALQGAAVTVGQITHPSPANPRANRGWAAVIERELQMQGIALD